MSSQPMSTSELAAALSCHPETIRRLYRKKIISGTKLGKDIRFESLEKVKEELAAYHNK